jgi:hypothetical protein
MDLVLYEAVDQPDLQGGVLGSAATNLRDVQGQAATWLRKAVLAIAPGLAARAGRTEEADA